MIKATFYVLKEEAPAEKEAAKIDGKRELLLKTARKKQSTFTQAVRPNVARLGRQVLGRYAGEPKVDTIPLKYDETAKEELRNDASRHVAEVMWPFPYRLDLSGLLKAQSPATSAKIALSALSLPVPRSVAAETDGQ
ncbi:hypothetical protein NEUTE2DRAFT_125240 [Neurospora tetrasperma FGSC 2509]|nr:hypothetical protein NEUTE2DRAFT_125240 [Neurospora tetrasperma FGSC 2509]